MKSTNCSKNLIATHGNCGSFVYRDAEGVHIGDCDNHEIFQTVAEALEYAKRARLSGAALSTARAAAHDPQRADNTVAEYYWHLDAGLQIDVLRHMAAQS